MRAFSGCFVVLHGLFASALLIACGWHTSQSVVAQETQETQAKELEAISRFLTVLEKNPRRGTALDRVYSHHVEFGTLDQFVRDRKILAEQASSTEGSSRGEHWMILGMIEYLRGEDIKAVEAFTQAESIRSSDPLASYYRGLAHIRLGDYPAAITCIEQALSKKPQRADELEIFQQLGRLHQRSQQTEQAMKVWRRLEDLYPEDPRVLEQIASTLADEGQWAEAFPRYEKLGTTAKDDYRRTMFAITAAEMLVKQGKRDEGIARMENLLKELKPDGWLYRDVRRRIDDCFLRAGDQDGLVAYYQNWLEKRPKDIEAMNRLARFLQQSARNPEAAIWFGKALELAPGQVELRKGYIDLLIEDNRFNEAEIQYQRLLEAAPSNADYLRDWGRLVLRNQNKPLDQRRTEALAIWKRMLESNPKDPVLVSQIADYCRQNQMLIEAESLYRQAIELAPEEPQYREYLGEFIHLQKRTQEAKTIWQQIAQGDRRTSSNLLRLAEILNRFDYGEEACASIAQAILLDPKDFSLLLKGAEYHSNYNRFEEAIRLVDQAEGLVENQDERESVLNLRISVLQSNQQLKETADKLEEKLRSDAASSAREWYLLARFRESLHETQQAIEAIEKAIEKSPTDIAINTVAARIAENSGDFSKAADLFRKLTQVDRRSMGDHWASISRLESQLGRNNQALEAAKQVVLAAPSKTESYEFYAQTCFRLGETEEGLKALRKALRINPNESALIINLGGVLSDQLRTEEAIELYWRAYEKSEEISDKISLINKLVPLHQQSNQFDKLMERLERERRTEANRRSATICIAQAWQAAGENAEARKELELLLENNTKDTNLLNQLAKLCKNDTDIAAAIDYQRQLVRIAPGEETEAPLAAMLMSSGQVDEAREIYARIIESEEDTTRQIKSLDSLIQAEQFETALRSLEPLIQKQPEDWELLYRQGICLTEIEQTGPAKNAFERILALVTPYETRGRIAEAKFKQAEQKAKADKLKGLISPLPAIESPLQMTEATSEVRIAVGLQEDRNRYYNQQTWMPNSYGLARMAALGWLLAIERVESGNQNPLVQSSQDPSTNSAFAQSVEAKAEANPDSLRDQIDFLYISLLTQNDDKTLKSFMRIAKSGQVAEKRFSLGYLRSRNRPSFGSNSDSETQPEDHLMDESELTFVRECIETVVASPQDRDLEARYGAPILFGSNGQAFMKVGSGYRDIPGEYRDTELQFLPILINQYRSGQKQDMAQELIKKVLQQAKSSRDWQIALQVLLDNKSFSEVPAAIDRWQAAASGELREKIDGEDWSRRTLSQDLPLYQVSNHLLPWIGLLASEGKSDQILALLDNLLTLGESQAEYRSKVLQYNPALKPRSSSTTPTNSSKHLPIYHGKKITYQEAWIPIASKQLDSETLEILWQCLQSLDRYGSKNRLIQLLNRRSEISEDKLGYADWCLATILWWSEDYDQAIAIFERMLSKYSTDEDYLIGLAELLERNQEYDRALAILDRITTKDQNRLIRREITALRLAERIGDIERARRAAQRLYGSRLSLEVQMQLVSQMKRLGMDDYADGIIARIDRKSGSFGSNLSNLLSFYQAQGKTEEANRTALAMLRRTSSSLLPNQIFKSGNRRSSMNSSSEERRAALVHLANSGVLKTMIKPLEEKHLKSPNSLPPLMELIEYSVATKSKQAEEHLVKAIAMHPQMDSLRELLAGVLSENGKKSEACDQYLVLLKKDPHGLSDNYYKIKQTFDEAKRTKDLAAVIEQMDEKDFSKNSRLQWIVVSLISNDQDLAEQLISSIEKLVANKSVYQSTLVLSIHKSDRLLRNDRIYRLLKKMTLPNWTSSRSGSTWEGLDVRASDDRNGQLVLALSPLLASVQLDPSRRLDLQTTIENKIQQFPRWLAGRAILGLLDLQMDKKKEGLSKLQALFEDPRSAQSANSCACWYIAQQLSPIADARDLEIRLLKLADEKREQEDNYIENVAFIPMSRLVNVVGKEPEQRQEMKKRIDRLLSKVKKQVSLYGDLDYANYHRSNNTLEISRWLLSLEYPIDAYLEVKSLIDDPNMGKTLGGYIQENSGEQATQILLDSAKKQIDDQSLTRSLDRLIPLSESIDLGIHHAMVKPEELNARAIHSNLIEMLEIFAASESLAKTIDSRIKELVDANPSDLSAIVLQASWMIERDCAPETLVPVLRKLLDLAVMETSPENRRASFAEQRQAKQVASLWLVARGILDPKSDASKGRMVTNHNQCQSLASQLAERAIEASYRQKDLAARFSVAWELVNLQAKNQQDELCRKSLNQFIDAICGGKKSMASPREINSDLTPPLSISEFRIVMAACEIAESRGYLEIASKAVNRSLQGGLPVSDPIDPQVNQFQGSASWRGRGDPTKNDGIEIEVQNALKSVLVKLTNRSDLPAELYHALRLVVLPSSQPDDVRLFINSKELENGQQDSLGSALVRVGVSTGQLHQLKTDLENRGATPNSVAPKNALLFLIAVESGDLVGAKEILQQSIPQTDDRKTSQFQDAYALMALRAFDIPELRIDSIPFLKRWVKNRLSKDIPGGDRYNYDSANASILPDYIKKLSRILIDQGEQNAVEDFLQTVLSTNAKRQMEYGSGSYALMQKRKDMAKLANDCVEVGLDEYAIDLLGRFADLPKSQYDSNWDQVPSPLAYAILKYRHLSPEQRYKLWYDWTMPTADRNTIRMVLCNLNFRTLPEAIISGNQRARQFGTTQLPPGVYSNLSELVLAASETNNLDSLGDQVRGMDQESSESTRVLLDLIAIQKKDPEQVDKLVSERINRSSATSDPESQSYEEVYKESRVRTINSLIAGFLKDRGLMSEFQDLLRVSEFNYAVVPNLGRDNQHWIYEDDRPWAPERGDASYQAWLNFPLQGDFTVSWDCPGLTTEVEFGGARLDFNGIALEDSTGAMHLSNTIWTTVRNPRIELRVQANEIDFRYNGKSISKQPTWGTSPWLGLVTRSNSHQWRNLKIEGNPTIPSEVSLISEESMDGWSSKPFNEPQWSPRLDASEIKDQQSKGQSIDKNLFVWKVQQGQIEATASLDRTEMTMESWLVYQRPMAPGESLRYEYFADAGRSVAHPTFGNTAMMLTPQGLKLHCITAKLPVRLYGLQTDNMIDVPQGQQKVKQLPIKEGQWNQVALDHRGNHIDLSINGYAVYSLPIEPGTEHRFGLFRFRNQGCLVRNAVLTGPWPKVVSDNLIADINANNPAYRADSSDLEKVIPSVFPSDWHQVIQAGGPETFQSLLDMVLPSQATSPRMPFVLNEDKSDPTRLRNPMVMDCLPVELVKTAHRQGKVDALRLAIDQFESRNPRAKIRVDALRALVQLESGDETAAIEALMKLAKVFKYAEEKNLNALDRTAILIVAKHAASKLDYQMISKYLMLKLIELPESQDQSSNAAKLPELLYQDFLLEEELQSMQKSAWVRSQWTTIPPGSHHPRDLVASDTRASTWLVAPGKATHIGGFDKSILIFQSPLVGNFEIRAKRTFVGDQDMNIDYGLHRTVGDSVEDSSELPDEQVANLANGEVARYQLIASDNTMTVHQNSAKIDGYSITNTSTPWLTLSAEKQECYGYIENLEILGSPTIPEEINISNTIGFEGWDGSLTGTAISSTGATDWSFQSDEIQSEFRKDYQFYPKYQDRYIQYLRPMLEDGVVEYEFYCSADTMVHPAIGSYAFLLLPDGIQVHRIAQIAEDQSTLLLVNTEPLDPPSKPIHFNMNQYNRAKLELKGDDLSIWVNGELVTTVVVSEPPSKRRIGLLAGTEKSAKVRNMKYRGDWPKQLPPVHQQVLAKP